MFQRFPQFADLLLEGLNYCRRKYGMEVYGFVIMPDHFHLLLGVGAGGSLAAFLRDWKGFVAHSIVGELKRKRMNELLKRFQTQARRERDSRYQIFQSDTHTEGINSARFFRQKLNYIHNNPVSARLASTPQAYRYSSARNYVLNKESPFKIDRLQLS